MKVFYDFHIHSCLSPCAENENTPVNIAAMASVKGLDMIAVSDHNAIENVEAAMEAGEAFGVTVVPSFELQTSEDIHVVCLFESFGKLKSFYDTLKFQYVKNDKEIFGEQRIVNTDDELIGELDRLLLTSSTLSVYDAVRKVMEAGGFPILAHIDREANGTLSILGEVPEDLGAPAVEFSHFATEREKERYLSRHLVLTDSDAHTLKDISERKYYLELERNDIASLFRCFSSLPFSF